MTYSRNAILIAWSHVICTVFNVELTCSEVNRNPLFQTILCKYKLVGCTFP